MGDITLAGHGLLVGWKDSNFRIYPHCINRGFLENNSYQISKPSTSWQLVIDDEPLKGNDEHWDWSPGFYAGMVRAELIRPDCSTALVFRLDVSPSPTKLGVSTFQSMINELWSFDPMLVLGTEPSRTRIGATGEIRSVWLEYARLRHHGEAFLRSMTEIARQPIRELQSFRQLVPLHRVRRADRFTIVSAIRDPNASNALMARGRDAAVNPTTMRFDVPIAIEHLDSAANRCILALVREVLWKAKELQKKLQEQAVSERQSSTRTDLMARWPRRNVFLASFIKALSTLHRSALFTDVTRPEISAAGLNAIAVDPTYASAYRHGWNILRPGVEGAPDAVELWLSPTWEVYERWAFTRIVTLIEKRWQIRKRKHSTPRGVSAAAARCGQLPDGTEIAALLQPRFSAWNTSDMRPLRSISGRREPDIAITLDGPSVQACLILDAKYRTSRTNILEAMASAHLYRDALRHKGKRILAAVLLTPKGGGAPWLEEENFIRQNRVGVIEFSTESSSAANFLIDWLADPIKVNLRLQ